MSETQNLRHVRVEKYDSLVGRYKREIKGSDIIVCGDKKRPGVTDTATWWDFATITTDAYTELFPYLFTGHATHTRAQFVLIRGATETMGSIQMAGTGNQTYHSPDCECPLFRIGPSSSVKILIPPDITTSTVDTYAAFLYMKREPIIEYAED